MPDQPEPNVAKITNQMMYAKLVEVSEAQVEMLAELRHLKDVPERLRAVELAQARAEWLEKIAFTALGSGIIGFGTALWNLVRN